MADTDAHARQALDVFCGLLGSTIGDMALFYGAHGGVYLAGGILPQIRDTCTPAPSSNATFRRGRWAKRWHASR